MDNLTKEQRHKNMQNIRSVGTKPEQLIAVELKRRKIYFTSHVSNIVGKPDFVFRRKKVTVFIDSDFWHGHKTRCIMPKTNVLYWSNKIDSNRKRDRKVNRLLKKEGWKVVRLWEYEIKNSINKSIRKILRAIDR
ncbi:MAG: very short patch repair endonuclease [Nitrospirae bacterium]|nr:very short patch repair endonuclease [Nitrospirota bacterium]